MMPAQSESAEPRGAAELAAIRSLIGGTAEGDVSLPVLTGSMAPSILPGDVLLVRPRPGCRVHAGDVAVFLKSGKVTAHRVVFAFRLRSRAFLLEKGDANRFAEALDQGAVLGVVEAIERRGARMPIRRGARADEARRAARRMLWRFALNALPIDLLKRAIAK